MMRSRRLISQQPWVSGPLVPYTQDPQSLGQLGDLTSSAAPFIFGAVTWAFFGETIKGLLGLGQAVAGKGISAAHKKLK